MLSLESITMDNTVYRVRVVYDSMALHFELVEGTNAGKMLSGRKEYALAGTEYGHRLTVEPDPMHRADFDAFVHAISAPVPSHHVELPYGQTTIDYDAHVTSGDVKFLGRLGGQNIWGGIDVYYDPLEPQRLPDDDEGDW